MFRAIKRVIVPEDVLYGYNHHRYQSVHCWVSLPMHFHTYVQRIDALVHMQLPWHAFWQSQCRRNYTLNWHQAEQSRTVAWMRRQILTYAKQAALLPQVITMTLLVRNLIKCTKVNDAYCIMVYALLLVSANDLTIYRRSIRGILHNILGSTKRADRPKLHDIHKIIS